MCIGQSIDMTGIFSGLVALATVTYAVLTVMMWREMRYTNKRSNIQAIFEASPSYAPLTKLIIKNVGCIPVYELTISISTEPPDFPGLRPYNFLKDIPLFHRSVPVLCENQEISTLLFSFLEIKKTPFVDSILTFKLSYKKTPNGKTYPPQIYSYDLAVYKGLSYLIEEEKGIKDIVKSLEGIAGKLK
jgi:hypothetical protein